MKSKLHLFIIWEKSSEKAPEILEDLAKKFEILRVFKIQWSKENFSNNMTRFYGVNLPHGSFKEVHTGTGPFLLVVINDKNPKFDYRKTTKGNELVNVNIFDSKQEYRSWIKESYPIHATNTENETEHNLTMLLGKNLIDFKKTISNPWDGTITSLNQDIVGFNGWKKLEELFYVLNATTNYVVLRNYENIFESSIYDDIDLLSQSSEELEFITNAKKILGEKKHYYHVKVNNDDIIFDFQFVDDNHYDKNWADDILTRRIFHTDGFYIPNDEDYFYSLLYHALYHKNIITEKYKERLFNLAEKLSMAEINLEFFTTYNKPKELLSNYMRKMNYSFPDQYIFELNNSTLPSTLNALFENLKNNSNYDKFFSNSNPNYVLINSIKNRSPYLDRQTLILYSKTDPKIVISFYKIPNQIIEDEFDLQKRMYYNYDDSMIPKPIEILQINNNKIIIREAIPGFDCNYLLSQKPSMQYIENILQKIIYFNDKLNSKLESSSFDNFKKEIDLLLQKFNSLYNANNDESDIIANCISFILDEFKTKNIFSRYSNGDFLLSNLILNDDVLSVIDFEFSEKTHLYFLEWFRFFKFQPCIPTNYFYKISQNISNDNFILIAAKDISDFCTNDKKDISFRLLFEIKNYVLQCTVQSKDNKQKLDHEMKDLFCFILNRWNKSHQIIDSETISIESLELEFLQIKSDELSLFEVKQWQNELANKSAIIANNELKITSLTNEIQVLQDSIELYQKQIMDIHQSFTFRMLRKYDNTIGKIIPFKPKKYLKSTYDIIPDSVQKHAIESAFSHKLNKKDILCFPIIPWDYRYQRPQHLFSKFAENGHRVFYFNTVLKSMPTPYSIKKIKENIFQIDLNSEKFFDIYKDNFNDSTINFLIKEFESLQTDLKIDPVIFTQFPTWSYFVMALKKKYNYKIIFDCLDDFHGFSNISNKENEENILMTSSDLVLTSAKILFNNASKLSKNVLFLPNAGEFSHFNKPKNEFTLSNITKPIVGYFGAIAEWFDVDLIEYLAKNRQDLDFVFIGSTYGADIRELNKLSNIHFLGEKPYFELPNYLHKFSACLIPFKINNLIKSTHPVKIYEYFSAGKPVICTQIPELESMNELCYIGVNHQDFLEKLDLALNENDSNLIANRIAFAQKNTWNDRFLTLYSKLNDMPLKLQTHNHDK